MSSSESAIFNQHVSPAQFAKGSGQYVQMVDGTAYRIVWRTDSEIGMVKNAYQLANAQDASDLHVTFMGRNKDARCEHCVNYQNHSQDLHRASIAEFIAL